MQHLAAAQQKGSKREMGVHWILLSMPTVAAKMAVKMAAAAAADCRQIDSLTSSATMLAPPDYEVGVRSVCSCC